MNHKKTELVDKVIDQVRLDLEAGTTEDLWELLEHIPIKDLLLYLPTNKRKA